ncbi:hypothetical protein ENUP19_0008G0019 [Entamoeba nuttalli]|uniref:Uncharacterized protein n=1 Tax=Entamoeba nuttalli TaxID=412467 RepID=A0ABQ0D7S2_9EUKA
MNIGYLVIGTLSIIVFLLFNLIRFTPFDINQKLQSSYERTNGINQFEHPTYVDSLFNMTQFNYSGECGKVFKYKANNKRDLLLFASSFDDPQRWSKMKESSQHIMALTDSALPRATKLLLLLGDAPTSTFEEEINTYGIEVVKVKYELPVATAVVQRIFAEKNFLEENKHKYDRVIIADFRDVLIFNDAFATFSSNDLILLMECLSFNSTEHCVTLNEKTNKKWMNEGYGEEISKKFAEKNEILMNGGLFLGGINKIIELLTIQINNLNKNKMMLWGQDQATLNYIHLTGQLNHLNITKDYCTQRMCFAESFTGYYDKIKKRITTKSTGCSPVIRHKLVFSEPHFKYPPNIN